MTLSLSAVRRLIPSPLRAPLKDVARRLQMWSLSQALEEHNLRDVYRKLTEIVPDIRDQYTGFSLDTEYLRLKVRALHAFQISLVGTALRLVGLEDADTLTIVDIGDSAGTHLQYLRGLYQKVRSLSVNIDAGAVEKIRAKGLEAIHARAEDIALYSVRPDVILSFETLEHLTDPIAFMRSVASIPTCKAFVATVPYVSRSRIGLDYIRHGLREGISPERVHVFELSPPDWRLLMMFSGWKPTHNELFLQYPRMGRALGLRKFWRVFDYEGFYGVVLLPDSHWHSLYESEFIEGGQG